MRTTSDDPVAPVKSVGQMLRNAREQKGKQLDDVWCALKIRPNYLTAIEEGRFEDLPGRAFAIGYVSRYARYLDMEVEKLPERVKAEIGAHAILNRYAIEPHSDRKVRVHGILSPSLLLAALTVLAYGITLYVIYLVSLILS